MTPAGVYLHIPFCTGKCGYCDFYSLKGNPGLIHRFTKSLTSELRLRSDECVSPVDSIYLGGGTPGLLESRSLSGILSAVTDNFRVVRNPEITVELNPENVSVRFLKELRRTGVNRVSLGIQTLSDPVLRLIGRRCDAKMNLKALRIVADRFENWSADLITGLPGRTAAESLEELRVISEYSPRHLSLYGLHLSRNAPLKSVLRRKGIRLSEHRPEYFQSAGFLEAAGYEQYEISNWSRGKGSRSRHNLHYWNTDAFFGFGPAASGTMGHLRRTNKPDLDAYLRALEAGRPPPCRTEHLTDMQTHNEYVMMRLRLSDGIDFLDYEKRTGMNFLIQFNELIREICGLGFGLLDGKRFRLNREGWFVSNTLISRFFL